MKISASIYSAANQNLEALLQDLEDVSIDFLHIDCFENTFKKVAEDCQQIRKISKIPIDFHAITSSSEKFYDLAIEHHFEHITFQLENLQEDFKRNNSFKGKLGLAITSETNLEEIETYKNEIDYLLLMTTTPGKSGGKFNKENFRRIREAKKMFQHLQIFVDGGINAEVAFVLRILGVHLAVSGSFLVNNNIAKNLASLRFHEISSEFHVNDFMIPKSELPILNFETTNFKEVISNLDTYNLGFVLFEQNNKFHGICSNADLRKGLLQNLDDLNQTSKETICNTNPKHITTKTTISEMLTYIKQTTFPILFLPVIGKNQEIAGAVVFNQYIKGEG